MAKLYVFVPVFNYTINDGNSHELKFLYKLSSYRTVNTFPPNYSIYQIGK